MANSLIGNSAVATHLYQAFYGQAPSNALYNSYIADIEANGQVAFAAKMANNFSTTTDAALALLVLNNLGVTATTVTATGEYAKLLAALTDAFAAYPTMRGQVMLNATNLFANLEGDTTYGAAATTYNNQALANFTYANNTANTSPGVATIPSGTTFTLTTGVDTSAGGSGNDTFNGAAVNSLSAFDNLDGGAGTNTLNANLSNAALDGGMTVKNIQTATLVSNAGALTADVSGWTGLTTLNVSDSKAGALILTAAATTATTVATTGISSVNITGGGVAASVTTGAGAVDVGTTAGINAFASVTVKGGTTVAVSDNKSATTSGTGTTLKTVSVDGNTAAVTVAATALTALNLANSTAGATVTGNTGALAVGLNTVTGTITDGGATSLSMTNSGGASTVTVVAGAATAVNLATSGKALTLANLTAGVAAAVNISGDTAVTITANTLKAAAVITSTNSAGVTLTQALAAGEQFVGTSSSGADTITVGAGTTAITTGAGNDTVTMSAAMGTGGSVDAGEGTGDILSMASTDAAARSASTTFQGTISNFEVLKLGATGAADAVNVNNLDAISMVTSAGVTAGGLTLSGLAATNAVTFTGAVAAASSVALQTATGTTDVVNLTFAATNGFTNAAALTVAGVETLNITTDDTDSTAAAAAFAAPITAAAVKSVVVAGDAGFNATGLTATTLTSLDASGLTLASAVGGLTWTSGALAASSAIKGGAAGTNTVDFSAANTASTFVTYTGGTGADNVTGANGMANVVSLGNGTNSYTGGSGAESVTGGTGVDTISTGAGADSIVGGGGADVITGGAGADKITISGTTAKVVQALGDSGTNTTLSTDAILLSGSFDVIYGVIASVQLQLPVDNLATVLAGTNFVGVEGKAVFTPGGYDAAAGRFTFAANGVDTVLTYDNGAAFESVILVGYVTGTGTTVATGLLAFA